MHDIRAGFGYDVHQLVKNGELILGGILIPFEKGLKGHSDADVLLHAIMDAMLGAVALGDIGTHFPDTDSKYKNANSRALLRECHAKLRNEGFRLSNVDATIVAQAPKLNQYINSMRQNISSDLQTGIDRISIKATTAESLGFIGRGEAITAMATVLVTNYSKAHD